VAWGKSANHINSTDLCDACHTTTIWAPATQTDHTQVLGTCSSCHDGTIATGKNTNHVVTEFECDVCHATTAWTAATP
jgi:hypothetical protein